MSHEQGRTVKRTLLIAAALLAVVAAGAGTYAYAAASDSTTINGCVGSDGKLRVLSSSDTCKQNETALSWNTTGPQGLAGPAGAQGPAGPAGRDGRDGLNGSTGTPPDPNAVAGTLAVTAAKQGAFSTTLTGFAHEIVSPRDPASGLPTGKRMHKPITITKQLDATTPLLLNALVSNETLTSVLIGLDRDGKQVATVKLTNASISDYVATGGNENWSFTYQKIEWTWLDGGITAQDDWEAPNS
jgi:type VI secretion system secreted protein Hcp